MVYQYQLTFVIRGAFPLCTKNKKITVTFCLDRPIFEVFCSYNSRKHRSSRGRNKGICSLGESMFSSEVRPRLN